MNNKHSHVKELYVRMDMHVGVCLIVFVRVRERERERERSVFVCAHARACVREILREKYVYE